MGVFGRDRVSRVSLPCIFDKVSSADAALLRVRCVLVVSPWLLVAMSVIEHGVLNVHAFAADK